MHNRFHVEHPTTRCNIISVDGGHSYETALADIVAMRHLADPHFNVLFVDDTNCLAGHCKGPSRAIEEAQRMGLVHVVESFAEGKDSGRGITVMHYNV